MTADEKERAIRDYWQRNQGLVRPTAGARAISASTGIPVNTVRGIQNRLFEADERPWDLPARTDPVHTCPQCGKAAHDHDELMELFGPRRAWRGPKDDRHQVESFQATCRTCKVGARRKARARARALALARARPEPAPAPAHQAPPPEPAPAPAPANQAPPPEPEPEPEPAPEPEP